MIDLAYTTRNPPFPPEPPPPPPPPDEEVVHAPPDAPPAEPPFPALPLNGTKEPERMYPIFLASGIEIGFVTAEEVMVHAAQVAAPFV